MTLEFEHMKPVEEMDAVEFRRYAKTLPEEERAEMRRRRNAGGFRRRYDASDRHRLDRGDIHLDLEGAAGLP